MELCDFPHKYKSSRLKGEVLVGEDDAAALLEVCSEGDLTKTKGNATRSRAKEHRSGKSSSDIHRAFGRGSSRSAITQRQDHDHESFQRTR